MKGNCQELRIHGEEFLVYGNMPIGLNTIRIGNQKQAQILSMMKKLLKSFSNTANLFETS